MTFWICTANDIIHILQKYNKELFPLLICDLHYITYNKRQDAATLPKYVLSEFERDFICTENHTLLPALRQSIIVKRPLRCQKCVGQMTRISCLCFFMNDKKNQIQIRQVPQLLSYTMIQVSYSEHKNQLGLNQLKTHSIALATFVMRKADAAQPVN